MEITQDSHQRSDKEDFTGVDSVCTGKLELGHEVPETIQILLSPSSMSVGSCSGISHAETFKSFEDCVAEHEPASFDAPVSPLCEWGGIELGCLRWEAEDAAELSRDGSTLSNGVADRLFADLELDYSMFVDSDSDDKDGGGRGDGGPADGAEDET